MLEAWKCLVCPRSALSTCSVLRWLRLDISWTSWFFHSLYSALVACAAACPLQWVSIAIMNYDFYFSPALTHSLVLERIALSLLRSSRLSGRSMFSLVLISKYPHHCHHPIVNTQSRKTQGSSFPNETKPDAPCSSKRMKTK